jgi:hypothetical protein
LFYLCADKHASSFFCLSLLFMVKLWFNGGMDIHAHRRQRLNDLIAHQFGGSRPRFSEAAECTEARTSQLLSGTFREGRNFGEGVARKLEATLNLPPMYFDQGFMGANLGADLGANLGATMGAAMASNAPVAATSPATTLDPVEQSLLDGYRSADPATQNALRKIVRVMRIADEETIEELAQQFCRAVNERLPLRVAAAPDIDLTAFAIDEQRLLLGFRGLKPGLQRVVRHAAHCANVLPDDDEIDSDTGCTRLELRLVAQYRTSTPAVQRAILRAAIPSDSTDNYSQEINVANAG